MIYLDYYETFAIFAVYKLTYNNQLIARYEKNPINIDIAHRFTINMCP